MNKISIDNEISLLSKEPYKSLVVIIPDRIQFDSSLRKNMCDFYGLDQKNIDPFLPRKIILDALKKYKIPYFDPTDCITQHQKEGLLYYTKDNHFTKFGHQIFSECTGEYLRTALKELGAKSSPGDN